MKRFATLSKTAFAFAALAVAALAIVPSTGPLVRQQMRLGFGGGVYGLLYRTSDTPGQRAEVDAIAARAPENFRLQLAHAVVTGGQAAYDANRPNLVLLLQLSSLADRFPREPAARAAFLRYASVGGPGRDLEQEFLTHHTLADTQAAQQKRTEGQSVLTFWEERPDFVTDYIHMAEQGQALEPDNAFFPFALASAQLSLNRDADAQENLARAARCSTWHDYTETETMALGELRTAQWGPLPGLSRIAIFASQLYPQYAFQRATSRIFVTQAVLKEQAGDVSGGFQIRHDLARVGALMRRDSTTIIGTLTGQSVAQSVIARPGGALPLSLDPEHKHRSSEERSKLSRLRYQDYLTRTGHTDEARWFAQEVTLGEKVKSITGRGLNLGMLGGSSVIWATVWLAACYLLLANLLWVLLAGGIAAWVARRPRVRDAAPLQIATRRALGTMACLPVVIGIALLALQGAGAAALPALIIAPALASLVWIAVPLIALKRDPLGTGREMTRDQRVREAKRSFKIYGKTVVQCLSVLAIVGATIPALIAGPLAAAALVQGFYAGSDAPNPQRAAAWFLILVSLLTGAGFVAVALTSLVRSLRHRTPASVGLVLDFRRAALPLATVLLLAYAGAALTTARMDVQSNRDIDRNIAHEGRFCAFLVGEPWPALTKEAETPAPDGGTR